MAEVTFRAMGSACRVVVETADADDSRCLAHDAHGRVDALERRWSRFRSDSDVTRLNAAAGMPAVVSPDTVQLIQAAVEANIMTDGWFDPLLLDPLADLGYDRSHERLAPAADSGDGHRSDVAWAGADTPTPRVAELLDVEPATGLVWLPDGVGFDPGGIGKGLAADLVADRLVDAGAHWVVVELGGDIAVGGRSVEHWGAPVEVIDPRTGTLAATLRVHGGGVATSSRLRRRWIDANGTTRHHLLDPRTGAPCESDLQTVTVIGPSAAKSEVLAKAALIAGSAAGSDLLERHAVSALLFDNDGLMHQIVPEPEMECADR